MSAKTVLTNSMFLLSFSFFMPKTLLLKALNATENDPAAPAGLGSHIFTREFARSPGLLDECRAPEVIEEFFTENQGEQGKAQRNRTWAS